MSFQRKDYWNKEEMSWYEKLYVFEIGKGLWVTFKVFARNMFLWMTGRKGALTTYYPEEMRKDYSPANRGKHVLTQRPDGSIQCVCCQLCANVCPAHCIKIEGKPSDKNDPTHPKEPLSFKIDYSKCVFCGLCVEACPEDALRMAKDVHSLASYQRDEMWKLKEELMTWNPQKDVLKPYPPKPKDAAQ